jgi:putative DNA primase/helicase
MPMELLAGDGVACRERLLSLGLTIEPSRNARDRLHRYISTSMPTARALAVSRLGWHDRTFVLPDRTFGASNSEEVIYQTAGAIDQTFGTRGTLAEWRSKVAAFCVGNCRLVAAVSASFAAALLYISGDESGGIHLVGPSSIGKTTALAVAGSVWGGGGVSGGGVKGYIRQWRVTANGLEATAAVHCDSLLCLDEISQVSPQQAGEAAYMLGNGMGKQRAQRDGSGRRPVEWRLLFLSTGEISLADKVAEDGRRPATAGQKIRVIDLPADTGMRLGIFDTVYSFDDGRSLADYLK